MDLYGFFMDFLWIYMDLYKLILIIFNIFNIFLLIKMKIHPLWFICILFRLTIILMIWQVNELNDKSKIKKISSVILLIIGIGFFYKGYSGSNNEIQIAKVFWHNTRYVHGTLYILSGLYLLNNNLKITLLLLLLDVIFSVLYRITFNK